MKGLHHVGITVKDLMRRSASTTTFSASRFLERAQPLVRRRGVGGPCRGGSGRRAAAGMPAAGNTIFELLEYKSPPSETTMPLKSTTQEPRTWASLSTTSRRRSPSSRRKAPKFYGPVNVVDEGVLAGWRWVYFDDPDGYPLELAEVATTTRTSGVRESRRISSRGRSAGRTRPRGAHDRPQRGSAGTSDTDDVVPTAGRDTFTFGSGRAVRVNVNEPLPTCTSKLNRRPDRKTVWM